jgi:hypothetical protein
MEIGGLKEEEEKTIEHCWFLLGMQWLWEIGKHATWSQASQSIHLWKGCKCRVSIVAIPW